MRYQPRKKLGTEYFLLLVIAVTTLFIIAGTATAGAQDKPASDMQMFIEKIKADKKLLVAENMQLTEKEAKAFWPLYEQYQNELFIIRTRTHKLIQDYSAAYKDITNSKAKKLLDEMLTIETLRVKLARTYLPKFQKALPDIKVARYYQIENKVNAALYYELAARIPLVRE
ncbi:MAG: hypothetical protein H6Q52_1054 [Deltaproteobacteria bacterium]|nr:hypothetical protein [Deltaproteobacteria bacterium]